MKFIVLTEEQPGQYAVVDLYDEPSEEAARDAAALDQPSRDVFFALPFDPAHGQRVTGRRTVIDWETP